LYSTTALNYQWNLNNNPIIGANGQSYDSLVSGVYSVTIKDVYGCSATSDTISVDIIILSIYPNPTDNSIIVEDPEIATIKIFDINGQLIKTLNTKSYKTKIDVSTFASGMYYIEFKSEKAMTVVKFVKE